MNAYDEYLILIAPHFLPASNCLCAHRRLRMYVVGRDDFQTIYDSKIARH